MKFATLALIAALPPLLSACATTAEPKIRTVVEKVPVREACVPADLPPAPAKYADDGLTGATPPDQRYLKTAEANLQRRARLARIEPVIAACR